MTATSTSISIRLPPESISTNSPTTWCAPVSDTVPMMMPATPVATPIGIMLRAPPIMPWTKLSRPWRSAASGTPCPRNNAFSPSWVSTTTIIAVDAQNADKDGLNRSIRMHHSSTTIGST